ncbi:MAG: arginine repressor [Clostridia bacterium]|nr:arginine repressor [Clostridia bacterium]
MKQNRHERIIEIIGSCDIETQDELLEKLKEDGFEVTQATISRDIKQLQLVKTAGHDGHYKYAISTHSGTKTALKFKTILKEAILKVDYAENIVVLKTYAGMAQAAAAAIDAMGLQDIVGSVAGDDTIMIVMRTKKIAQDFTEKYKELLH